MASNTPEPAGRHVDGSLAQDNHDGVNLDTVPLPLKRPAGFLKKHRGNFYLMVATLVVGFLANSLLGDLYSRYVSPWKGADGEHIGRLEQEQREQFAKLNESLTDIQAKLPREGRDAFDALQRSLANVERDSAGLVHQLDLAHREIESLRTLAADRGGLGSGHDFTLSRSRSMDLAPGALIGLTSVNTRGDGVRVNLTSAGVQAANNRYMQSGESLTYAGIQGQECWVSLMSIRPGDPGAASFKTGCKG